MFLYICGFWAAFFGVMKGVELLGYWDAIAERVDVVIRLCYVQIQTTRLNRAVGRLGALMAGLWKRWFFVGAAASVVLVVAGLLLLSYNAVSSSLSLGRYWLQRGSTPVGATDGAESEADQLPNFGVMTPLIPGVNLPSDHVLPFFLALLFCGVFHELGHALAAAAEGIRLKCFGVFVLFVFPGAFASISDKLLALSHFDRIKVFAAGAFHNLVSWVLALAMLAVLPWLLAPAFRQVEGQVVVAHVEPETALAGHVFQGDRISSLNGCLLADDGERLSAVERWTACFEEIDRQPTHGFCLSDDYIVAEKDANGASCCQPTGAGSELQCFSLSSFSAPSLCTSARNAASQHRQCASHSDCDERKGERCAVLVLPPSERLVKIGQTDDKFVLYAGDLSGLWYSLQVTDYEPRFPLPALLFHLPYYVRTTLQYVATLSLALAVLNMVPAYRLDGQQVFDSLMHMRYPHDYARREKWSALVLYTSTALLVVNVLLAFITLYYRSTATTIQ